MERCDFILDKYLFIWNNLSIVDKYGEKIQNKLFVQINWPRQTCST